MADDQTIRSPQDRSRISLSEDYEVRYWTDKFGMSKWQLAEVVQRVGPWASDVEQELR